MNIHPRKEMTMRETLIPAEVAAQLIGEPREYLTSLRWIPTLTVRGRALYSMDLLERVFGFKASAIAIERARLDGYTL